MSPGGNVDVDPVEEFPLLARLLQAAADRGEGTVLGLVPPGRSRIGRVSRVDAAAFAERLAAAYRERSPAMVRYATRKVGDPGRAEDVVQRAFEKILRRQQGDPPEITNMQAYVLTAVCNEINRELREVIPARANVSIDDPDRGDDTPSAPVGVSTQVADAAVLTTRSPHSPPRARGRRHPHAVAAQRRRGRRGDAAVRRGGQALHLRRPAPPARAPRPGLRRLALPDVRSRILLTGRVGRQRVVSGADRSDQHTVGSAETLMYSSGRSRERLIAQRRRRRP